MVASANATTGYGEELAARHTIVGSRLSAASEGWQGRSAAALIDRAAAWSTRHAELLTRIGEHANHLHDGAYRYFEHEQQRSRALTGPMPPT